jgi:mannitol-1-phosphate 5-dehydrogenase
VADKKTLVGFGFGAIQTGLFLWEAQQSGHFDRLVIALPNEEVVGSLRRADGHFSVNVATRTAREICEIHGVEIYHPKVDRDREVLVEAIADAAELTTALPSVATFEQPETGVTDLLAEGLRAKLRRANPIPCILYASENHNHAAELLHAAVARQLTPEEGAGLSDIFQPLNTVIGKMSRVVRDPAEMEATGLHPYVPGGSRAYLVESFNRILVSEVTLPGFRKGIEVFVEKPDLLPFEEAKLYGHNAAHALLGYLGRQRGLKFIAEAQADQSLMTLVRDAFLEESGRALIARRGSVDPLFTREGYTAFVDDLLERMVNPWLRDDVERVTRDSRRKLGWDDRLVGTMRLALRAGIQPNRLALGAASALEKLCEEEPTESRAALLEAVWKNSDATADERSVISKLIITAKA